MKKLALETRADLARPSIGSTLRVSAPRGPAGTRGSRRWIVLAFTGGLLLGAVLTFGARLPATEDEDARPSMSLAGDRTVLALTTTPAGPVASPGPLVTPYTPPVVLVSGRSAFAFRGFFAVPGSSANPLVAIDVREAMAILDLNNDVALRLAAEDIHWSVRNQIDTGLTLVARIAGRETFLFVQAVPPARFDLADPHKVEVRANGGQPPRLMVWASSIGDESSGQLHVDVSLAGDLYIADEPIARDVVIWRPTGEALDVSSTVWESDALVGLPLRTANDCDSTQASCQALLFDEAITGARSEFPAPMDGMLTCRQDGVFQLDGTTIRLALAAVEEDGEQAVVCHPGQSRKVAKGDAIVDFRYLRLTAESRQGDPISVVVAPDGTLYAGKMFPLKGCPCR